MMKKRIVALLLAGLMSATALASCRVQNQNQHGGTEPNQNPPTNQTTPGENTNNPPAITWQEVDKNVYSISDVKLRQEASGTSTALASIAKETALHCTKQSTSWYYVEYGELKGYVSKASVTEINILGTDFVEITGGSKVMYANAQTINVRLYPTDADFSTAVGSFKLNDEVTVVATNGAWHRVQYIKNGEQKTYYVSAACLNDEKVKDPDDTTAYENLFTAVNGETGVEKYVKVDQGGKVNFRKAPNTESTIIMSLSDGVKVTVLKTGTVNGMEWSYIVVRVESDKDGVPSEYKFGYISSDYLSNTTGDMTLDDLLAHYPTFTKVEGGMMYYVLKEATITIRREPVFPADGEASNSLSNPQSGKTPDSIKAIKVVATGTVDGTRWFIVEFVKKEGDTETLIRGFVGGKALEYLTTDANGNPTVTIEDLIAKYPQFTKLETPTNVTASKNANTYGTPDASGEVLGQITAGTTVKLVAQEAGAYATWYVVEDAEGKLLFVGKEFFN